MVCRSLSAFADAPRAGSVEAKNVYDDIKEKLVDAPRAGSAEAKYLCTCVPGGEE